MISFVNGVVAFKERDTIVLDNHGIGYGIHVTQPLLEETDTGEELMLYTYLYLREDIAALYGFRKRNELEVFRQLLSVSGIGPKAAISLLSTLTVENLVSAVYHEDVKAISKTPGIGPKGAKRLIMELKDKLNLKEYLEGLSFDTAESDMTQDAGSSADNNQEIMDAVLALEALGYSGLVARKAVRSVPDADKMDSGSLLKEALKYIR